MKHLLGCLMTASMLAGCAANPPAPAAGATTANNDPVNFKIPAGYRQAMVDGQERFCRQSIVTGSRVSSHEVCLTLQQVKDEQEKSQSYTEAIQRAGAQKTSCNVATGGMGSC